MLTKNSISRGAIVTFLSVETNPRWTRVRAEGGRVGVVASKRLEAHAAAMADPDDSDDSSACGGGGDDDGGDEAAAAAANDERDLLTDEDDEEEDLPTVPDVEEAVMRLFADEPEGYTKHLDSAFTVENIVEEFDYQHSTGAVRQVLDDMSSRSEPFIEQREGRSDEYYLKRSGGGDAVEGGGENAAE